MRRAVMAVASVVVASGELVTMASAQVWSQPMSLNQATYSNENAPAGTTRANQAADNFLVTEATVLSDFTWWGQTYNPVNPFNGLDVQNLGSFNIRFYHTGGSIPGEVISTRVVTIDSPLLSASSTVPHSVLGGTIIRFDLTLDPPVSLPAAGEYWVSVAANLVSASGPAFAWQRSSDMTGNGAAFRDGPLAMWSAGGASANQSMTLFADAPIDTDGDGLTDAQEAFFGTNPNVADTDSDELTDFAEIMTHGTSPLLGDTDADGLLDGTEIALQDTNQCLSPLVPDADADGLLDGFELLELGTNPCLMDSDGDGLSDAIDPAPYLGLITTRVLMLDAALFDAPNENAAEGKRGALSNQFGVVLLQIENQNYAHALTKLNGLSAKIDEWLIDCAERDALQQRVADLAALVYSLI